MAEVAPIVNDQLSRGHDVVVVVVPPSSTFTLFPALPAELRHSIWTLAMRKRRLLRLVVDADGCALALAPDATSRARLNPGRTGRTCREARAAYTALYRIPLPLRTGTLRISPDLDILDLRRGTTGRDADMARLLDRMQAQDPRGPGALSIALDHRQIVSLVGAPTGLGALATLYIRCTPPASCARMTSGWMQHPKTMPWLNASMPLLPPASCEMVCCARDARPEPHSTADRKQVWAGWDPRTTRALARPWLARDCRVRVLLAAETPRPGVQTSAGLAAYLRAETAEWLRVMGDGSDGSLGTDPVPMQLQLHRAMFAHLQRTLGLDPPVEYARAPQLWQPRTAVGFWIFDPDEADEPPVPIQPEEDLYEGKAVLDLRRVHVELGVVGLDP
ncbi:hypothetical protein P8C59_005656 [Phyllachora maydis]|uniref:2EXR domain-containing protein n=1 Tax=Phyllachora maydis TaxID=1825666 RepID=A0AAD9I5Z8_9PEZI|nr:hypothetical protein P8C59_005656 [Phyllachora maydis]